MTKPSAWITGFLIILSLPLAVADGAMTVSGQDIRPSSTGPIALWTFDPPPAGTEVVDAATGTKDALRGRYRIVPGVAGSGLAFDGYTTCAVRKGRQAPRLGDAFTIDAWVAPAALPWSWVPIVGQEANGLVGYSFGVGPLGEFGLKISVRGAWVEALSPVKLPLRKWSHIAASFKAGEGIRLFLDGLEVASRPVAGAAAYAGGADLLIGMNPDKRLPSHIVGAGTGTIPAWFAFDGIMDEIRIHNRALGADDLARLRAGVPAPGSPALSARLLPAGPKGPARFGAYYTKLAYEDGWDALWPVGPAADIVVRFDDSPVKVIFWRGTRYGPAWVMDNGQWIADQSFETWDGIDGCFEHMEDPRCLNSNVRILESTEARAVVHWRYAPMSSRDHRWRVEETAGWGLWVDEYYYFYPDRTCVRKMVWTTDALGAGSPSEVQETIPLCEPGQNAEDILNPDALTLLNLNGESRTYSWPGEMDSPAKSRNLLPANPNIQVVNLKSKLKPFIVFEPGCRMTVYIGRVRKAVADFSAYNHWPVSLLPSDGRFAIGPDRVSSFSISYTDPPRHEEKDGTTWAAWIYGAAEGASPALAALGRSWAKAPELRVTGGGFASRGYDIGQRAYVLDAAASGRTGDLRGEIQASDASPVVNVALFVKNWSEAGAALTLGGRAVAPGRGFKVGHIRTLEGTDLAVWFAAETKAPLSFVLSPR